MGKKAFERKLAALEALRDNLGAPDVVPPLQKALGDGNNYYVSKAARLAGESGHRSLVPDLTGAFARYLDGEPDKQCWAKTAICRALIELGYRDPELYLRGSRVVQREGVMGGEEDTAETLRGYCALALVDAHLPVQDVLNRLTDMLGDHAHAVRLAAVRAMASLNRAEGTLPLRLLAKIVSQRLERWGNSCVNDPRTSCVSDCQLLGEICGALLAMQGREAEPLLREYIRHTVSDARGEIAGALVVSSEPVALEIFANAWRREADADLRESMLKAAGASPSEGAFDFLASVVENESETDARRALEALAEHRFARERGDTITTAIRARTVAGLETVWLQLRRAE